MATPTPEEIYLGVQRLKLYFQQNFPYKHTYYEGSVDPLTSGYAAPVGAVYAQKDGLGDVVNLWLKTSTGNNSWKPLDATEAPPAIAAWSPNTAYSSFADTSAPTIVWEPISSTLYYNTQDFTSSATFAEDQLLNRWLEVAPEPAAPTPVDTTIPYWDMSSLVGDATPPVDATDGKMYRANPGGTFAGKTVLPNSLVVFKNAISQIDVYVEQQDLPAPYTGLDVVTTIASASGILTIDLSLGKLFQTTLYEDVTSVLVLNPPPAGFGTTFVLWITQDAVTPKTFAMPAFFTWDNGLEEDISTALGATDMIAATTRNGTTFDVTLSRGRA